MCYVSYQIDRHLADQDREDARNEWLGMKAEDDSYGRYLQDAFEQCALSESDAEIAADTGDLRAISTEGQEAVRQLAVDLAIEDGFSRYDE